MENKHDKMLNTQLEEIMQDRFGRYSKYIIQERALPDVRDGLKPVQRRILYAMYADGNTADKTYRKSAKTVGLVIGNYHPHGDSSVYDAMVRLSQSWKMNVPLVDMQGNNGSVDDDPAAAMRYTEARLSKFAQSLLNDIEEETVIFTPNFDDTSLEPSVLPASLPHLLVNGSSGIAAGYATNIPPHSINEILEGTIYRLNHPDCGIDELSKLVLGPDFPTGGIVFGHQGILDAFRSGKGRIVIRAKAEITQTRTIQQIIVTEIPYEVIKSNLVKKLDDIRLNKQLDALLDVRDETDRNGMRIVLDLKKDADANLILNYLYKNTDLQIYYTYNMVTIVNQRPVLSGLIDILDAFIAFRKEVVLKRSHFRANAIEKRMHILEGLIKAISVLDEVITLIRSSKDKQDAKLKLIERFVFTDAQAEAIVTLRLYRLTNTDIIEIKQELAALQHEFQLLSGIIKSPDLLKNVLVKELQAMLANFKQARRSQIEKEVEEIVIDRKSMIPNEKVMLTATQDGYLKRVSMRSYQSSEASLTGLKEGDKLLGSIEAETYDTLLVFSDKGSYAQIPLLNIEDSKWKDIGNHFGHYVKSEGHEKLISAFLVKTFNSAAYLVSVTKNGMIKRSPLSAFEVSRINRTYDAMSLSAKDEVIETCVMYEGDSIFLSTLEGYGVHYAMDSIPENMTKSKGVKAMNLSTGDHVVSACVHRDDKASLMVIAQNGQMKRVALKELELNHRPAKGELLARKVKSNPLYVQHLLSALPFEQVRITPDSSQWVFVKDIPLMEKTASFSQGVKDLKEWYWVKGIEEIRVLDFAPILTVKPNEKKSELTSINESSLDAHLIIGSEDLPNEVLAEDHDQPQDIEFIHFDL